MPGTRNPKRETDKITWVILILTVLCIPIISSVWIPPDEWFLAGMLTLLIPAATLFLVGALIFFLRRRSWWGVLAGAVLFVACVLLSTSFSFIKKEHETKPSFRLVTHNMNALKYYVRRSDFSSNLEAFQAWAVKNDFDVLCLQEMIEVGKQPFVIPGYQKASSVKFTTSGDNLGLFVFTRFPIIRQGEIEFAFNSYNRLMWTDLAVGTDTVRIVNVHLMSYDLKSFSIRKNIGRIRAGLRARSWHAKLIHEFLLKSPYPVILCGDFNETPVSYPYRKMNSLLNDVYAGSGAGFDYSFRFAGLPIRIDHIFVSPLLRSQDYDVIHGVGWSDHSPVSVRIGWPAPAE